MDKAKSIIENNKWTHQLEKDLSEKRYKHTLRVAVVAHELAIIHHCNTKNALVAGLLHDCAKNFSDKKLLKLADKYKLKLSEAEEDNADLIHAKVGAHIARDKYGADNADVFNAIAYHTTGRASMSLLEKIIYISDYIEPKRKHNGRLDLIRKTAKIDLNQTMLYILEDTLAYLETKDKTIDPLTKDCYNYYKHLRTVK